MVPGRASGQLHARAVLALFPPRFAGTFHQHLVGLANSQLVLLFANCVLDLQQFVVASFFDLFRHVIRVPFRALGARPLAVLENETVFETAFGNQVFGQLEVFLRFTAESDDEIAGDCRVGDRLPNSAHHFAILFHKVPAFHPLQDRIRSALRRHVQIVRALGKIPHGLQQVVGHVAGVIGDKFQAVQAVDVVQLVQQIGEASGGAAVAIRVAVDGLAQQGDFATTFAGQLSRLGEYLLRRPSLLGTPNLGHNTIRTKLVTADLNADVGLVGRRPHLRIAQGIVAFETARNRLPRVSASRQADLQLRSPAVADAVNQIRNLVQLARSHDQVDVRCTGEDPLLMVLSHTADDPDDLVRILPLDLFQASQRAVDFFLRVLADAAGVKQQHVRFPPPISQLVTASPQTGHHQLAVQHVHLAADGFEVKFFCHAGHRPAGHRPGRQK